MRTFTWREVKGVYMFSKAYSAAVHGIDGLIICVEADVSDGLPMFDMVGYLSSEVREAKERVRIAMKNSNYKLPPKRITINLSPADVRKEGTAFDLPISIAILSSFGLIPPSELEKTLIIGELSLNGVIQKVNGILPIVLSAQKKRFQRCIVPKENAHEGAVVQGIDIIGVECLTEVVDLLNGSKNIPPVFVDIDQVFDKGEGNDIIDFSDIVGQEAAKRAVEIAVSGLHNLLLLGPPGAGKTMIAKRIPTIMPVLSLEESMEITKIYSVSGALENNEPLITKRPYRSPHHTITSTALTGGGRIPRPGEISLSHLGVLFLDELPEFNKKTIEILRQPLEDHCVTISRIHGTYEYPANFMLVGAANPCKCGFYPDRSRCHCTLPEVKRYLGQISRPLLDRMDLCVEVLQIPFLDLEKKRAGESSKVIRDRVRNAREIQLKRYQKEPIYFNSSLPARSIKKYCPLGKEEKELMEQAYNMMELSARGYHRILKVARTIADLDGSKDIQTKHLSEAICYRSFDVKYWREM